MCDLYLFFLLSGLAVAVEGPAKAEIQCHDNGDGSCDITWYPVEAGEYTVHIRFADEAIPGSPYKVRKIHIILMTHVTTF